MAHIKKMVMHGFKSFPRKTEIPFTSGINVILGPNGSGKSNISDALCFVLGRLSIKSMRAAKAKNLIFMGTKKASPAKQAMVEMVFDNSDNAFSIDEKEISIKRIVRKNGQSVYKINEQTKTRQEILSLLAQAGIDPNGFNIILQGEIQNFSKMHTEERRKIVEEVSGISIYESRKKKSLRELEKTEEKLKEVNAVLRERTSYLNNLEKERKQALRFKKLEKNVKRYKAGIIESDLKQNKDKKENLEQDINRKNKEIEKFKNKIKDLKKQIQDCQSRINEINSTIQKSTGIEQEKLNHEIANLRAEIAGKNVKLENYENKISEFEKDKKEIEESVRDVISSIKELERSSKISSAKKRHQKDLDKKKERLEELEKQRKKFYVLNSELRAMKQRIFDKKSLIEKYKEESEFILKQTKSLFRDVFYRDSSEEKIKNMRLSLSDKKKLLEKLRKKEIELEKKSSADEHEISNKKELVEKISEMDICPVCKNRITEQHINSIKKEALPQIESLKQQIKNSDKTLSQIYEKKDILQREIEQIETEISKREIDMSKLFNIEEKKEQIKEIQKNIENSEKDLSDLEKKEKNLSHKIEADSNIEKKYDSLRIEIEEVSMLNSQDLDSEISFKKRELERYKISLKQIKNGEEETKESISELKKELEKKNKILDDKKLEENELSEKFKQLISERENLQKQVRDYEIDISSNQNYFYNIEQAGNNLRIERARFNAIIENLEIELQEFKGVDAIKGKKENLIKKLHKTQEILSGIGSVNMRSLEVYDQVKKEYENVRNKVDVISNEKESILRVIHEIDFKKKKVFMKTLNSLNEIFSRNFSHLSSKGQVFLELEDRKNPFEGGVAIVVKTGHGKYFDVTSLSGGEQTLVALSLIFAIQEYSPYCFYVLDEIDAALDKRNSERLAELLKKYMRKGQYIVVTHNDQVISRATHLYGVSMHDGISKIISLKV